MKTVAVAALALLAPALPSASPGAPPPGAPRAVRLVRSEAPSGKHLVPASVVAARRATIATRIAARVAALHAEEGQRVSEGALLVSLSDPDLRGALEAAERARDAATANERRIRSLAAVRAATPAELELAVSQRAQADAAVAAARTSLSYAQIQAPFAGTIQARRVSAGDLVGPGQPLFELEGSALELQASVTEAESGGLAVGQELPFGVGPVKGVAVITALTPGGDPVSHRRGLRARVVKVDGELRSGAFARLEVPGDDGPGRVWVPRSAVVERGDLTGVFVASAGKAELRWVALGERVGGGYAVRAGLRADEAVIDEPGALRDGEPVELQR
jgi:RND family efflux transporter MFP subunit